MSDLFPTQTFTFIIFHADKLHFLFFVITLHIIHYSIFQLLFFLHLPHTASASTPIGLTIVDYATIGAFFLLVLAGAYYLYYILTKAVRFF